MDSPNSDSQGFFTFPKFNSTAKPKPAITNSDKFQNSTQTLPPPNMKSTTTNNTGNKRGITFATLPPPYKSVSTGDISGLSKSNKLTSILKEPIGYKVSPALTSGPTITTTQSRFKLPPTPLTSPNYFNEEKDSSIFFSKRQIARSVDGNIQMVEVGLLTSMFYSQG